MATMVEILVAIAIVGLMLAMGINNSQQVRNRLVVMAVAEDIRSGLRMAKANAQSGKKDCAACGAVGGVCGKGDAALDGWQVTIMAGSYTVGGECGVVSFGQQTKDLPQGVVAEPSGVRVLFGLQGQVMGGPLTIALTGAGGVVTQVTVTTEGGIQ